MVKREFPHFRSHSFTYDLSLNCLPLFSVMFIFISISVIIICNSENRMWSINENCKLHVQLSSVFVIVVVVVVAAVHFRWRWVFFTATQTFTFIHGEVEAFFVFTTKKNKQTFLNHTISNWWFSRFVLPQTSKTKINRISTLAHTLIVTCRSNSNAHVE